MRRGVFRFSQWLLRWPLRLLFRVKVQGEENIPSHGGFILCSNHTSNWDPILLAVAVPRIIRYMAKQEIFEVFGLRRIAKCYGAFPVDRGAADMSALDTAAQAVENGDVLGIFPEGTRSKTGELLKIKLGIGIVAAKTSADILPVCVLGKGGKKPIPFRRTYVHIGKLIPFEELAITSDSPRGVRNGVKMIAQQMKDQYDMVKGGAGAGGN